ncbi:PIN domain-containing protein [Geodermatophilus sp. DF01-2]|uniref:PIN domain-containing protein n=1 Tax=Geodermatophilus sp. DF01-2 TaxID=2559610 RepID=UPI001073946D|nr:PIN domain-containing protein [Geodermatophilus sp. DF01_2]TFV64573.1 PIN domain-containing protein [Geodermatophilus sp. DF01_2]
MNLWLLDASVLLASEDPDDENHHDATRLLEGSDPLTTLDLAYYEVTNVAVRAWRDLPAAHRLRERVEAVADDGGLARASPALLADAAAVADEHGISVYDAAYVAAARASGSELVSCDVRDLVSRGLARLPGDALAAHPGS